MSLNQKYTWHDFLRENPEHKEKGTKRTSSEGKKAFESAFKAHCKKYLEDQQKRYDRQGEKAAEHTRALSAKVSELRKAKKFAKAKVAQKKAGRADAAVAQIARQKQRSQAKRKSL
jgi:1,6-anhydro-N-acetylmuramate kinase